MINVLGWTVRAPSVVTRLVLAVVVSAGLMVADHRGQHLERIRSALNVVFYPLQLLARAPSALGSGVVSFFTTKSALEKANTQLREEHALMMARLQQFDALEQENNQLRQMLGSATRVTQRALAADLVEVSPEPFTRKILIAKGERDGIQVSQAVIDAHGLVGQITQVMGSQSRVTLITDPGHAVPALVNRNGLRAIVYGTGNPDALKVPFLTPTADVQEGDVLVSSGMGGTFPAGYPVATITKIVNDPNEAFLEITAQPLAKLNHSKQVVVIWPDQPKQGKTK